ncbi:MAG TPA: hypothetical protein PKO06_04105, partial [Candidatus Ozemobacteraceae bacterium]|nr:hypothetical protein [Candidatus Ozemobacteraceae bacterium]
LAIGPALYLAKTAQKQELLSEKEFTATLLAQHALERVIAYGRVRPGALPPMTEEEPVVVSPDSPRQVSWYFLDLFGHVAGISETDDQALYWHLKPFTCEVKTYLIEQGVFKVIVYIGYLDGGRQKKVFLERLFDIPQQLDREPQGATP